MKFFNGVIIEIDVDSEINGIMTLYGINGRSE